MTHDYKRNGATTLFGALNTANGEVFHLCQGPEQLIWTAKDILEEATRASAAPVN